MPSSVSDENNTSFCNAVFFIIKRRIFNKSEIKRLERPKLTKFAYQTFDLFNNELIY